MSDFTGRYNLRKPGTHSFKLSGPKRNNEPDNNKPTARARNQDSLNVPLNRTLRLGNFPPYANDSDIRAFFKGFRIIDWTRDFDNSGRNPLPVGYVLMFTDDAARRAILKLNECRLLERTLFLTMAEHLAPSVTNEGFVDSPFRRIGKAVTGLGQAVRASISPSTALTRGRTEPQKNVNVSAPTKKRFRGKKSTLSQVTLLENKVEPEVLPMSRVLQSVGPIISRPKAPLSILRKFRPGSQSSTSFHDPQRPDTFHRSRAALEGYSAVVRNHDSHAPKTGRWNLAGHYDEDKMRNVVTEDEWNSFNNMS
ncbi:hypothetical protein K505DRAFT_374719 [Melanomma pulvis-pyrius CBS 109.77]|uniref:RRM domain-containing protein n=1 Tax=Melanomma pulvis-pyrius CBS 109.77 TaxID=1314802 RepID=A0A6A6XE55_9PLEO|nr:hypothetical protein K505DRAFT_374719 [Melanomma pulvis-pyrius CBS 109.77]